MEHGLKALKNLFSEFYKTLKLQCVRVTKICYESLNSIVNIIVAPVYTLTLFRYTLALTIFSAK